MLRADLTDAEFKALRKLAIDRDLTVTALVGEALRVTLARSDPKRKGDK